GAVERGRRRVRGGGGRCEAGRTTSRGTGQGRCWPGTRPARQRSAGGEENGRDEERATAASADGKNERLGREPDNRPVPAGSAGRGGRAADTGTAGPGGDPTHG